MMKTEIIKNIRNSPDKKLALTIQEAAALLGVKDEVVSDLIESNQIKVIRFFDRINIKISRIELEQWIENNSFYKNNRRSA